MDPHLFSELTGLAAEHRAVIVNYLVKHPEMTEFVCENLRAKRVAAETGDGVLIEDILQSEQALLEDLIKKS